MRLQIHLKSPGFADGIYKIRAKGFLAASFFWADENGILPGWSAFAYVPISPAGDAEFRFCGRRAIPRGASHVLVRAVMPDFETTETVLEKLPEAFLCPAAKAGTVRKSFSVMSDLHFASKPWRIRQALRMTESERILLVGDIANDGKKEQYEEFLQCVEEVVPEKILLPVAGNHDWPVIQGRASEDAEIPYLQLQETLLRRAGEKGVSVERSELTHWNVRLDEMELIGLNCVAHPRRLIFSRETESWLRNRLDKEDKEMLRVILCHAPLMAHNPQRGSGDVYLSRNSALEEILSERRNVIFLSGHTHVSPNYEKPCAEYEGGILYLNDGSIAPTELRGTELYPAEWKDGVISEVRIYDEFLEILMKSARSGVKFPRGYYRFPYARDRGTSVF